MHHSTDRIAHTTAFIIPIVDHCLEREIAQPSTVIHVKKTTPLYLCVSVTVGMPS